jgi:transposase InsO family protein
VIFAFIKDHRGEFPVQLMCDVLEVSPGGYYLWLDRPESKRAHRHQELVQKITKTHQENRRVYGSPRVHQALLCQGEKVSLNTVAKVMKTQGIKARSHKRFRVRTTDSTHSNPVAPNTLAQDFAAAGINQKWATDITYLPTDQGFLYLAGVIDLCSRRIVGWSMSGSMETTLVRDALAMALKTRKPPAGLLHHSDRGVQYTSREYRGLLESIGAECSMSRTGNCYDNAMTESFWGKLKTEMVHHERFTTHDEARAAIFDYIEVFYNRQRLHSSLDYMSPEQFEATLT